MKTEVYYFTGTGNSLWIARKIRERLEDSILVSIPNVINDAAEFSGEVVGIVSPVYMYNMPHLVADFIGKLKSAEYIFFVFSGAGDPGTGIKKTLKLFEENKLKLSSVFNVPMPSNYTPYGYPPEQKQNKLFSNADKKVHEIVEIVRKRGSHIDSSHSSFFRNYVHPGILYQLGYGRINVLDKSFLTDENCNGCSLCQKVCPVNNITMKDNKPAWNNRCQQCYACLQWCPKESIQVSERTVGIKRYRNPNITVKDIIGSSKEPVF